MRRKGRAVLLCVLSVAGNAVVQAGTVQISATPTSTIAFGQVIPGSSSTTFTVDGSGTLTQSPAISAGGAKAASSSLSALTVTLDCSFNANGNGNGNGKGGSATNTCASSTTTYTFTISSPCTNGGAAYVSAYTYVSLPGATVTPAAPGSGCPLTFTFTGIGSWPVTLTLGFRYVVPANATRGATSDTFSISYTQN